MTTQKAVALRISSLLIERDMSFNSLCKKIAINESTVRSIMNERYSSIKFDTLIKIADGFDMTIQEFLNNKLFIRTNLDVE